MKSVYSLLMLLLISLAGSAAQGDLVLGLAFDDSSSSKMVISGSTVLVDLFLTDLDASTPMAAEGLVSGGGRVFQSAGTATVVESGAVVAGTNVGPAWGPAFPGPPQPAGTISSVLVAAPFPFTVGLGATTIHLARFMLDVTGAVGTTATITPDELSAIDGIVTGPGSFTALDSLLTGVTSVDVTIMAAPAAVPEPSSLLVATMIGGYLYRRRRMARSNAD